MRWVFLECCWIVCRAVGAVSLAVLIGAAWAICGRWSPSREEVEMLIVWGVGVAGVLSVLVLGAAVGWALRGGESQAVKSGPVGPTLLEDRECPFCGGRGVDKVGVGGRLFR